MRLLGIIFCLILVSCGQPPLIDEIIPVEKGAWPHSSSATFSKEITDTLGAYNYSVQLRHGGSYSYRNLILLFKTFYPNNTYKVDTVDCPLAAPNGRWYGSGLGDIVDNQILFKINQRFPMSGTYKFEIQHVMRADTIREVYDVGLLVSEAVE